MSDSSPVLGEFILKIMQTLEKNGFPENKVSLPLEKLYESAHAKGINFNRVLEFLSEKEQIEHTKEGDRIIFEKVEPVSQQGAAGGFDMNMFKNMDLGNMMSQASDMMKNISPDQLAKASEMMKNMSPAQMSQLQNMFANMSPEQMEKMKEEAEKFLKK